MRANSKKKKIPLQKHKEVKVKLTKEAGSILSNLGKTYQKFKNKQKEKKEKEIRQQKQEEKIPEKSSGLMARR